MFFTKGYEDTVQSVVQVEPYNPIKTGQDW
jgi:hypothetical protein